MNYKDQLVVSVSKRTAIAPQNIPQYIPGIGEAVEVVLALGKSNGGPVGSNVMGGSATASNEGLFVEEVIGAPTGSIAGAIVGSMNSAGLQAGSVLVSSKQRHVGANGVASEVVAL